MPKVATTTAVATTDATASTPHPAAPMPYEDAIERLDTLVRQMEDGSLSLEQSLKAYQEGAGLIQQCRAALETVDDQVKILEAGMLKPFDEERA